MLRIVPLALPGEHLPWSGCGVELERALDRNSGDLSSSKPLCLAQLCDLVQVTHGMVV